jgi:PKHD-type hydroxylase
MIVRVPGLLNAEQLAAIDAMMAKATYVDGRLTGGAAIKDVKNNLQVDREASGGIKEADAMVLGALGTNPVVRGAVLPKRVLPPYYTKYIEGMAYGAHVDNPLMATGAGVAALRTDVSITVFLDPPDSYDGGELQIKGDIGDATVKLPAGDAIVYPTGAIHQVLPVSRGERRAVITWMQSMIADPTRRRIVYELDLVCQSLLRKMPNSDEHRALIRNYGNLVRLWSEP